MPYQPLWGVCSVFWIASEVELILGLVLVFFFGISFVIRSSWNTWISLLPLGMVLSWTCSLKSDSKKHCRGLNKLFSHMGICKEGICAGSSCSNIIHKIFLSLKDSEVIMYFGQVHILYTWIWLLCSSSKWAWLIGIVHKNEIAFVMYSNHIHVTPKVYDFLYLWNAKGDI